MATASSTELRLAPHKEEENTAIAYSQKDRWQNIPPIFQKVKGMNKTHLIFLLHYKKKKKSVGSEDQGPEILQGKNEREGIK